MASIGIGERLRSARQALGLSLEEIESLTHIRRSYLEALEREAFEALPGPAYARGFLRAYASCLGLPPQDLLERYPVATAGEVSHRDSSVEVRLTPAVRMSPARRALMGAGVLVVLGALFLGFVLYTQVREFASTSPRGTSDRGGGSQPPTTPSVTPTRPPAASPGATGAPPRPGGAPQQAGTPSSGAPAAPAPPPSAPPSSPPPNAPRATSPAPPPGSPAPSAAPGPAATPGTTSTAPPAPPLQTSPLNVAVAASGYTWVRAVADGATVFEGFMNGGDKQTWQAKRSLTVRVGNAAALNLAVNGRPMGALGNPGQVYEHTFSPGAPTP